MINTNIPVYDLCILLYNGILIIYSIFIIIL